MNQDKKIAFISGGMSGIGYYMANMYWADGYDIALFDLNIDEAKLTQLQDSPHISEQKVRAYQVDISQCDAVRETIYQAVTDIGAPTLALNSAGVMRANTFDVLKNQEFEFVIGVNLFGSKNFAQEVLKHMPEGGRLALIASLAGLTASYSYSSYCASKHAVVGLAKVLRIETKPRGISVSVICPPEIDTPMVVKELETMHPVTRELKNVAGTLTLKQACDYIYAKLNNRQFLIIPGFRAKLVYWSECYLPNCLMHSFVDRQVRKVLKQTTSSSQT